MIRKYQMQPCMLFWTFILRKQYTHIHTETVEESQSFLNALTDIPGQMVLCSLETRCIFISLFNYTLYGILVCVRE